MTGPTHRVGEGAGRYRRRGPQAKLITAVEIGLRGEQAVEREDAHPFRGQRDDLTVHTSEGEGTATGIAAMGDPWSKPDVRL